MKVAHLLIYSAVILVIIAVIVLAEIGNYSAPIFTLKHSASGQITASFIKNESWRIGSCSRCNFAPVTAYNFSGMYFTYSNGTMIIFNNVSSCYPIDYVGDLLSPLDGCFNPPKGNYTIYGHLNKTQ